MTFGRQGPEEIGSTGEYAKPFSVRVRTDVREKLEVLASYQQRSRNDMVKHLIEQAYNRLGREIGHEELDALDREVNGE